MRTCDKPRCDSDAWASVALRYDDREVHVGDLSADPDPGLLDLCRRHADGLTPPMGWRIVWLVEREPART